MRFVVVYENRADFVTATELADRVLIDRIHWLEEESLATQREWVGTDDADQNLTWASIAKHARKLGIRVQGHFGGQPGLPDAQAARRAILYILHILDSVDAILLIRDLDDESSRRLGLEQARSADQSGKAIILGVANCERECWVLCGFEPEDDDERKRLDSERQKLGFDPCLNAHRLDSRRDHETKSSKRVLRVLTVQNKERERRCWMATPLPTLCNRGGGNGLKAFLEEIKTRLAVLICEAPGGRGKSTK